MCLAQNEADVLRYGWVAPLGSSRTMAMGGAFGALGADLGCMGINPAGLGLYRRGDLAITTGLNSANTDASWNTTSTTSAKFQGTTGNLGVALTYPSVDADWPFFTLAVGRQVRMPFNQRIFIEGVPSESTVSDLFVEQALDDAAIYGYAPPTKRWAAATSSLIRRRWLGAPCCSCPTTTTSTPPPWVVQWKSNVSSSGPAACGKPKSGLALATATG